jgi:hypothetical protein
MALGVQVGAEAVDRHLAEQLWTLSVELTGAEPAYPNQRARRVAPNSTFSAAKSREGS